jgi:3'(2'), 5'-bisphosphate nucleotidase
MRACYIPPMSFQDSEDAMSTDLERLTPALLALARRAGAAILEVYRQPLEVITKADASPLTMADLRSHQIITTGLTELTAAIPILSEESSAVPFATRTSWPRYWLVDPLDGTKEFLKRNGEFTVNIALIEQHDPVLGVVYVPAQGVIYWGGKSFGAYRQFDGGAIEPIHVQARAASPLRVVGSRSHGSDELGSALQRLGAHELVPLGSSLKFCSIAEGRADVYPRFGPTSEWDTAAAQAVVEGAGGRVLDMQGQPLRYNTKDSLLNPYFVAFGDATRDWIAPLFQAH